MQTPLRENRRFRYLAPGQPLRKMSHKEEILLLVLISLFSPRHSDTLVALGGKILSCLSDVSEWLKEARRCHQENDCEGPQQGIRHSSLQSTHHVEDQTVKLPHCPRGDSWHSLVSVRAGENRQRRYRNSEGGEKTKISIWCSSLYQKVMKQCGLQLRKCNCGKMLNGDPTIHQSMRKTGD